MTELESTVLAITALRRLGDEAGRMEPSADAWPRLRARLDRWRPIRWAVMSPTTGMAMSVALVAVLIAPLQIGGAVPSASPSAAAVDRNPVSLIERRTEAEYISRARHSIIPASETGDHQAVQPVVVFPRSYPDNYRPERKEVSPAEPTGRPSEAI
jgi:hypothetical protein